MSSEKKKTKRSFSVIFRLIQLALVLVVVFFLSFFVTIAIKTSHPIDYIKATYFDKPQTDKIINDYANEKKNPVNVKNQKDDSDKNKNAEDKASEFKENERRQDDLKNDNASNDIRNDNKGGIKKKIDGSTLSGKFERIMSIKQAVNEKIRDREHYLKLDEIPLQLRQAVIAVEDSRFYKHSGFDIESIARATVVNVEAGQIEEGASTITQQLVKNLFLSQEQSFTRKAEELILSMNMERNFSKNEILELYLNTIYFGSNFYGIYDAAKGYFDKEPKELTLAESAMLAGLPNAPSLYSPYVDFMLAKKRQLIVINAMVKNNALTEQEAEKARIETITLARE